MLVERGCGGADERLGELEKVEFHDTKEKNPKIPMPSNRVVPIS